MRLKLGSRVPQHELASTHTAGAPAAWLAQPQLFSPGLADAHTPWHLPPAPPKSEQWGHCDPHRILVASQCQCGGDFPAAILEVLTPSSLQPPQEEMQKDTSLPPPSVPLTSNAALGAGRQPSTSGLPSKSEPGRRASPKAPRKPSISKVILGVVANKGARNRVSLATLKKAVATRGYDMTRNAWRFKRVLKSLVDKGMLKQVTGKGASGSFLMGKKQDSKFKLKQPAQRRPGPRRLLLGSKQGSKRPVKGVRRAARCRRS
uniref:H15 domain-containing protein n=1 Tax=Sus scrofa TaxID=9823 RepID=A0A287A7T3_PIG